ncbi:MAG: alkaline phosphatase family protein [Candidatus Kapaibacterium sp.]|nr:MAG: alkaline phosphatase family protein [Candidatus Kapabacteria bacterium]
MIRRVLIALAMLSIAALSATPRLVVLLCYDQLRADRIEAVRPWLSTQGFLRLLREGVVAERCMFDYATTVTAAGHATIATGCNPAHHGIVGNDFVIGERALYATDDTLLGVPSPRLLLRPTLGDYLKANFPQSKVWSFSHKDRGAIFFGGYRPDGACWLVPHVGLGSSRYYHPLPAWVDEFNRQYAPARVAGTMWNAQYVPSSALSDTVEWEGRFPGGTTYFPHRIPSDTSSDDCWRAFALTPMSVEWLFHATLTCIEKEHLGADSICDLLCISVSTTDLVGHHFGHDSREYAELLVACDRILAAFLDELDRRIGREHYVLVLTSDHGAGSIPELLRAEGLDAGRIRTDTLLARIQRWFVDQVGHASHQRHVRYFYPPWLWLDRTAAEMRGIPFDTLCTRLAQWLTTQEGIGIVMTARQIQHQALDTRVVGLVARSYHAERCGDLALYPREHWIFGTTPAQHGTPYPYDRWVPLVFFGGQMKPGTITVPCSPADIMPTLARMLDLSIGQVDGKSLPVGIHRR